MAHLQGGVGCGGLQQLVQHVILAVPLPVQLSLRVRLLTPPLPALLRPPRPLLTLLLALQHNSKRYITTRTGHSNLQQHSTTCHKNAAATHLSLMLLWIDM